MTKHDATSLFGQMSNSLNYLRFYYIIWCIRLSTLYLQNDVNYFEKKSRKICETEKEYNKIGWRRIASPAGMELAVSLTVCGALLRIECLKALLHAGVVNAQELVLRGSHVDEIRLTLGAFFIEELVHRLIRRRLFQVGTDDLVQRFPKMR